MPRLTICGGGNAAHVLIALAAKAGWEVDVYAPLADEARRLRAGITAAGGITARFAGESIVGIPHHISADPAEVIPESDVILLALPAFAHGPTLEAIAGFIKPNVCLGAVPARSGFDFQARSILNERGLSPRIFGLQTLPWACRIAIYGQTVDILGTKAETALAISPPDESSDWTRQLTTLFGLELVAVDSFLTLTLANTGQLIHPGIMYGLSRNKESKTFGQNEIPLFYQGVDPTTAELLQAMSDEVQAITIELADRLSDFKTNDVLPIYDWLLRSYPNYISDGSTLQRAFNTNRAYAGLRFPTRSTGPDTFVVDYKARYLSEDVPYGLAVIRGMAELVDVRTPTIDKVIDWAQARLGRQYVANGTLSGRDLAETRAPQVYGIHTLAGLVSSRYM
ncbi:MAG TPA: NAD/NADP octopine/nopaline dehydrogenase family protein [candidate division Zixibacteria bacterium]|nr:NAD/NADP octopine/nopaline dehydrogenase family protein [candidate division Zixibacteria bacterium]